MPELRQIIPEIFPEGDSLTTGRIDIAKVHKCYRQQRLFFVCEALFWPHSGHNFGFTRESAHHFVLASVHVEMLSLERDGLETDKVSGEPFAHPGHFDPVGAVVVHQHPEGIADSGPPGLHFREGDHSHKILLVEKDRHPQVHHIISDWRWRKLLQTYQRSCQNTLQIIHRGRRQWWRLRGCLKMVSLQCQGKQDEGQSQVSAKWSCHHVGQPLWLTISLH